MSEVSFNNCGLIAKFSNNKNNFFIRRGANDNLVLKKNIFVDISFKIDLKKNDKILDIGCGDCQITKYYKKYTSYIDAIDHQEIIGKCKKKFNFINFHEGNFLNYKDFNNKKFDKIVAYSVVHYLSNISEFHKFIKKALKLLKPGGILLLGDVPNVSKKKRFIKSPFYLKINSSWNKKKNSYRNIATKKLLLNSDDSLLKFDDLTLLKIVKKYNSKNVETYYLHQNNGLYLNNTRIDLLIKKIF
jgi:SAM-dependent methyltransferase